ncbi:hypothetical protein BC833DRAFT_616317 [Globomyces pollinis-pini]|nr:hypothetical protein BC833DRAFT_616317 [Globomyces pollinis-pini]
MQQPIIPPSKFKAAELIQAYQKSSPQFKLGFSTSLLLFAITGNYFISKLDDRVAKQHEQIAQKQKELMLEKAPQVLKELE